LNILVTTEEEDKELEDNRDSHGASIHGSSNTTLNVLINWICVIVFGVLGAF
jgi:hypothetical protein